MNFTVYSKEECPYCYKDKTLPKKSSMLSLGMGRLSRKLFAMIRSLVGLLKRSSSLRNIKSSNPINNNNTTNRGVDYILSGGKSKKLNTHAIRFGKIFDFCKKEIHIYFELSLGIKNQVP
jgi:glutaredoxin